MKLKNCVNHSQSIKLLFSLLVTNAFRALLVLVTFFSVACTSPSKKIVQEKTYKRNQRIRFVFPLRKYQRMSRGFRGKHKGIDVAAKKNTPIHSVESGWVTYVGRGFRGYGKLVIVEHSPNWSSFYAHMNAYGVKQGQWVERGHVLGLVGRTGRATGDHLHFELRHYTQAVDPMEYLNMQ